MLITLSGAATADAASGMVNTVVQLGIAAGSATIGTVFFDQLLAGEGYVTAMSASLLIGLGTSALLTCFLLPSRPRHPATTAS